MSDNLDEPDYDWITSDGQRLKLHEMGASHIENCIAMLERQLAAKPDYDMYGEPDGDMAQEAYHAEIRHNEAVASGIERQIEDFNKELMRRAT